MFQLLVTTMKWDSDGSVAIHTVVVQFLSAETAERVQAKINENGSKPSTPYTQRALQLW